MNTIVTRIDSLTPEQRLLLAERFKEKKKSSRIGIASRDRQGASFPLSHAQQRLWFMHQLDPTGAQYNVPGAARISGPLHIATLCRSLAEIVRRHESLRTFFPAPAGQPVQKIAGPSEFHLPVVDLTQVAPAARESELERLLAEEARRQFDLSAGPLLRAAAWKLADSDHVLAVTMHHAISDSPSVAILIRELAALYEAYAVGLPSPLEPLPVQYADYAAWQQQRLQGSALENQLAWWKQQLAGVDSPLELPADRARQANPAAAGAVERLALPRQLTAALKDLSRREGATLFMTLLAAFKVLLHRYTGKDDIIVGSSAAARGHLDIQHLIGCFVNMLPLRSSLAGDPEFRQLLARVRESASATFAHADVPFEKLVETLATGRELSRSPLFQVIFNLREDPANSFRLGDHACRILPVHTGTAKFDLTLEAIEAGEELTLEAEYSTELFEAATIQRLLGHLGRLLEAVAEQPGQRLSELPLLTDAEQHQAAQWNNTTARFPNRHTIHELIERQVESTPDALAVAYQGTEWSYRELNRRANQLAHFLRQQGVGPESLVGVSMERSLEMVLSLVAILKAGGAYVPIDPDYPAERIAYMLQDAGVQLLLTQQHLEPLLAAPGRRLFALDRDWPLVDACPDSNPGAGVQPHNLAYMIYTSGSTGRPKGAMNTHHALSNRLAWMQHQYQLSARDRVLQKTPFSFDVSVWEFFWPLLTGAALIVAEPGRHRDSGYLAETVARHHITTMHFVPSMLQSFVEEPALAHCASLRRVIASGEALPLALEQRFFERCGAELHNLYGPTEAAIDVTWWPCRPDSGLRTVPIGQPIWNTQIHILDKHLRRLPAGVPGELYIAGVNLARGYYQRPGLTAEKFVPDPFSAEAGARMYRTGDIARNLADGSIEYLGRIDHQVKIRGLRIELGEIEARLGEHAGVRECAVVVREDAPGDQRLVGYVVAAAEPGPAVEELRRHLAATLPEYMVPAAFVMLQALPLSPNGKLERRALPAPQQRAAQAGYIAPRTADEELLAGIWAGLLRLERVGIDDNFFVLGGHSLLATQVVARVRAVLGVELPLRAMFEAPTLAQLAARVAALRGIDTSDQPRLEPATGPAREQLSWAQQRLWFLEQFENAPGLYHIAMPVRLRGQLQVEGVKAALCEVVRRHEALRTGFVLRQGQPVAVVMNPWEVELPVSDLRGDSSDEQQRQWSQWAAEQAREPFDLTGGRLLRVRLVRLADEEQILLLCVHHLVADGWSLGVLVRELGALYEAWIDGRQAELPAPVVQYGDYAAWQREWLSGEVRERQMDYWKQQLAGSPGVLELPTDHARPALPNHAGASCQVRLAPELVERLEALSRRQGVTLFMTLLAAFQTLLSRYSGQSDIAVGTPIANRTRAELEGLIGMFVNTLVLRTDLADDPTFERLLERVREVCLGAYAHQDLPFEQLVEALEPERELSRHPLFQVLFVMQNNSLELQLRGIEAEVLELRPDTAKFDLLLEAQVDSAGLLATVEYSTELFEAATIRRLLGHLGRLLEAVAEQPQQRISELPLLTDAEQHQAAEWNDTIAEFPRQHTVHELFEQQVAATPDAIAVAYQGTELSYRELNRRTNQLAHYLRQQGVGPESLVGVSMERSAGMLIALLGVLKAGAAYLPLDPAYPADRLAYMVEDSKARLVLTGLPEEALLAAESDQNPRAASQPESLAYVIYTSGSTGRPKGVQIPHRAVTNFLASMRRSPGMEATDTIVAVTALSFDIAVLELLLPVTVGARIVIAPRDAVADGSKLAELLSATRATMMQATPVTWRLLLDAGAELGSLKVLCGGEALPRELAHALVPRCAQLWNMYGPTETTVWSAIEQVEEPAGILAIGRPIANTEIYILDRGMQQAPIGVPGEIFIGGEGLARGYWHRPGLTAEKFIPDPFSPRGARLYRTGDLGRWLPDGRLECLGRLDHQVKLRGFRIELGEIEARLSEHPSLRQSVVVAREDTPGDRRLVAYVVAQAGAAVNPEELRAHLSQHLPEYMVPAVFVELAELPLTPNGKVDRRALPAPQQRAAQAGYFAPRTADEELLAGIWAGLLRLERVGIDDNFFALGGHSLLATQVVARVRAVLGVELPLRAMFEAPTLAQLAARVAALRGIDTSDQPRLEPASGPARQQLSWAQQRLWFLEQFENAPGLYHIAMPVRLRGQLQVEGVQAALCEVVRRHEALRTGFVLRQGQPVAVVMQPWEVDLPVSDLRGDSSDDQQRQWSQWAAEQAREPFDLGSGRLLRVRLVRLADEEQILLLCVHHLVADGWSLEVLVRELGALYEAWIDGRPAELPAPVVQYGDYAAWQREWLSGEVRERQMDYWKQQLAGSSGVLEMPTDHARPALPNHAGASCQVRLAPELVERLEALSRRQGVTLFMTLLAAFQTLLSRYSGQSDIAVGTPIANRTRAELEGLIGMFVNTLVLRTDLANDPPFEQLLERVREVCLGAYAHQDLPFEQLVEALEPERELSRHPLFQVMFVMQNNSLELQLRGIEAEVLELRPDTAKFDLLLEAQVDSAGLLATVEYSTELFEAATIRRLLGHLGRLLEAVAEQPGQRLSELPLLTDAEQHQAAQWNNTTARFPNRHTIHELIEQQVESTPDALAVAYQGTEWSYRELNRRANQLAHFLRQQGVGPESLVGVSMERSLEMVLSLVAILKAGGAYVPIDPDYPAERIAYMLQDAGVQLLLTQQHLEPLLAAPGRRLFALDRDWPLVDACPDSNPGAGVQPHNLAYMIYTSGSTGRPKGAMNTHHALSNRLAWMQHQYQLSAQDRVLQKTPFSFDVSVWEFFWPLLTGAALIVAEPGRHRDSGYLAETVARHHITTMHFVPSMLQAFVEEPALAHCASLRRVIASGEALPLALEQRFFERCGAELHNLYGPTEAAIDVTWWPCRPNSGLRTVPIGHPIWNTQIHILDKHLRRLPAGVPGELYIAGVNLARGYYQRPGLTAEKFVPDPFSAEAGARMYRTGDIARNLADGSIEYLGRVDHQVKIRGLRIELGEIEARLGEHAGVRECAVVVREDVPGDQRLVGYVVAAAEPGPAVEELRRHLAATLPEYMVPAAFVMLQALPLSPNGKLERRALPAPQQRAVQAGYIAPRTADEELLAGIWAGLLRLERVGIDDNFFVLGGHSLLATQVVARVRAVLGVELPLRAMFEAPTLAQLAARVAALRGIDTSDQPRLEPATGPAREQLSWAQQRLWFLEQFENAPGLYHIAMPVRLRGQLQVEGVKAALCEVVRRHEALRTGFVLRQGQPVAVVMNPWEVELPVSDLRGDSAEQQQRQWSQWAAEQAREPFDLAGGRLLRVRLVRLADEEQILLLCVHHLVADGWSLGVLVRELGALYEAWIDGRPAELPAPVVQYGDYAAWQREWLSGEVRERQMEYWKQQLAGSPGVLELPTDHARPALPNHAGASCQVRLAPELVERLEALSRRQGVTLFMTLLAAFQTLLSRYSGQSDIAVGTPIANRTRAELEGLIGMFVNTLVLRTDLANDPPFEQLLERVREVCLGAYAHQDLPFEQLVEALEPERELSRHPLFQVMFVMHNNALELQLRGIEAEVLESRPDTAKFDLLLEAQVDSAGLLATVEYSTELFEAATIQRLLGHLGRLLEAVAEQPGQRLSELPLLTDAEQQQAAQWNNTAAEFPRQHTIHELIEQQVASTPDALAVAYQGTEWSYRELNRRANQLAHFLRQQGVGPESLVGVSMERSLEMVLSLVAILKAGGAYVPIDPDYPAERIAYMLQDAGVQLLLTQQHLEPLLAAPGRRLFALDRDWPLVAACPDSNPGAGTQPHNLAYMIYTSGSTGRPKGAMNTHHALSNRLAWMQHQYQLSARDRVLQKTPFSFDVSVWEFFWPLLTGAALIVAEPGRHRDSGYLAETVARHHITTMHFVPSMLQAFVEEPALAHCASLRRVIASGEALPLALEQRFFERCGAELHNLYGPTEAAIDVTWWPCRPDSGLRTVPIGQPIWNTQIHILDKHLRRLPAGVPGELYIAGVNLARGYYQRPGLTAEKFVPDPFSAETGARMYRTGDIARNLADGSIEYLGRVDHQVKIRGLRIELGEIEARLGEHAGVRECAVIVREDTPGDQRLVAYVVAAAEPGPAVEELRRHLAATLPEYMVPAAFVMLQALPLSPNGKLERRALPALDQSRPDPAASFVAPRNPVEETLAAIFADILKVDRVGVYDNFFMQGGHSLLATQVISRARAAFNFSIPLRALFESPTVAALAERVSQDLASASRESAPAFTRVARQARRVSVSNTGEVSISL